MVIHQEPRLRQVVKTSPLYPLNSFPSDFPRRLASHVCARLATRGDDDLEGKDWERIFADCIGAKWSPSNVGLDDITHLPSSTAWGAKTVKGKVDDSKTSTTKLRTVRLISGRNSTDYSFGRAIDPKATPARDVGEMVLEIWNKRVREVRSKFENLRTVVLIKDKGLQRLAVFEMETEMYQSQGFNWLWNKNGNLEGHDQYGSHRFTWQPHGSQFTIVESIPEDCLRLMIREPKKIPMGKVLEEIGFDQTYYSKI